jgi:hypothetical protein
VLAVIRRAGLGGTSPSTNWHKDGLCWLSVSVLTA